MKILVPLTTFLRGNAGRATCVSVIVLAALGSAALLYLPRGGAAAAASSAKVTAIAPPSDAAGTPPSGATRLEISVAKARALGVETVRIQRSDWKHCLRLTGRVELNAGKLAHVGPLVSGVLREVLVEVGERVQAGQVLAYIDSREVGEAKLALVKDRLQVTAARRNSQWHSTIQKNTAALLQELEQGAAPDAIEKAFRDRPVGTYREQLVSAWVRRKQAQGNYARIRTLGQESVIAEKEVVRARTEKEAAEATYVALVEQIRFDAQQQALVAEQEFQAAEAAAAISRAQLLILGYAQRDLETLDPLAEAERIAYFPVRAPLAGTVIARSMQLSMHVDPKTELLRLADLSTVWLRADAFEKDLSEIRGLQGQPVAFRVGSYPGREFAATVFSLGDRVDEQTRAVPMLALAENPQQLLKPGMFVEVAATASADPDVLQMPSAAVQRHAGATFVFVADGEAAFLRRDVQLGRSLAQRVEIRSGLREGEAVVVRGAFALKSALLSELLTEE